MARDLGGVYVLKDPDTKQVMRVGHTKDLRRRQREHGRDPALRVFLFEARFSVTSYAVRRGLEQLLHEEYAPPLDKIEPISAKNPRRAKYLAAARRFLQA